MKNIRFAVKIGIGFGALIVLLCVLGGIALLSMNSVRTESTKISEEYIPEVTVANNLERMAQATMYEMRGYGLSEDEQYLLAGNKNLAEVKKSLEDALALAGKHPDLSGLREKVEAAKAKVAEYERLVALTVETDKAMDAIRITMDKSAAAFLKSSDYYIESQKTKMEKDIEEGASVKTLKQTLEKIALIGDVINLGNGARVANYKSQALRNPKFMQEGLQNLTKMNALFERLRPLTYLKENQAFLEDTRKAGEAYAQSMQKFLDHWLAMQDIAQKRGSVGDQIVSAAKEISLAGTGNSQRIATNATVRLQSSSNVLMIGLILAVILGVSVAWIITVGMTGPVLQGVAFAKKVAGGDLSQTLDIDQKDEIGELSIALNAMVANLKTKIAEAEQKSVEAGRESQKAQAAMLEAQAAQEQAQAGQQTILQAADQIQSVVEVVTSASQELSAQIEESSRGAEEQSNRVGETATAMEEMNATVLEVARNAGQAAETADIAKRKAEDGATVVKQVVGGIGEAQKQALALKGDMTTLGQQAQGIGQILNVISDIADQTNLLALNAAIEAARAGEAGRGFAVVADEVRKLAEKTMTATKEVGDAIAGIQNGTRKNIENVDRAVRMIDDATELADKSGSALGEIVNLVELTTDQIRSIATASEEQSAASEEINRSIEDVNRISAETSDAMRQSALAVNDLANQAQVLKSLVDGLQSGNDSGTQRQLPPGRRT